MSEPTRHGEPVDPQTQARAEARAFLHTDLHVTSQQLQDALSAAYGDSYAAGMLAAAQQDGSGVGALQIDAPQGGYSDAEWQAFWDKWEPGSDLSAALVDDRGLGHLLDSAGVTIQGIVGATLNQMGTALADGIRAGDSVDTIAKNLSGIVSDPSRAYMIANTETARAMTAGSVQQYRADGVLAVNLLTSPGACDVCVSIADNNPQKLAENIVPVHPNCRCSLQPVTDVMAHPTDEVGTPEQSGAADLATVAGVAAAAGETEAEAEAASAEREREDDRAAAVRQELQQSNLEPPHTVPEPNTVPNPKALLGENTGGGMTGAEENTGGGMTAAQENTGAGGTGLTSNTGGGMHAAAENPGSGQAFQPEPAVPTEPAPKRTRKRTRGGKPVKR